MNDHAREKCRGIVRKALAVVRPQFRLDLRGGIHGVPHWSRVWLHGRAMAQAMDLNPAVLAWFAFLHDSRRHSDRRDPWHGHRAADFALQLRRDGAVTELDRGEFERLCEAMRLHSDGHVEGDPLVRACWDADRLDLGRVGIRPDPTRLCTDFARHPACIAHALRLSVGAAPRR